MINKDTTMVFELVIFFRSYIGFGMVFVEGYR